MGEDMQLNGNFYSKKRCEYSEPQRKCVEDSINKLEEIGQNPLMMLGKIQSGKTKAFIGVLSLAFDNGYDLAIVLTKNSNALAKQTTARMHSEFSEFVDEDLLDIYDIMMTPDNLSKFELNKKMILIVKKQHRNLPVLMKFIQAYSLGEHKKCLIIDDEADFTSIGFNKNKEDEEFDLKIIASQINDLRIKLECKFVQVTATPYSLYLQPENIDIRGEKIEPIKPSHTILVPSGEGYIGGDYYFNEEVNPNKDKLFYQVSNDEVELLKSSDRRKLKEENALKSAKVIGLRDSILNFVVGGCIRVLQNGGQATGKRNKFSFIIHTETKKESHKRQIDLVHEIITQIEKEVQCDTSYITELVESSYQSFKWTEMAYGIELPNFEDVKTCFQKAINDGWISRIVVNSENDIETLLDKDGQLKLRTPLTIFVGGQILDRGVTISNLIGFYYGRRPKNMQQDTVLQHSRMFGYRNVMDLSVTRFYTTQDLYERMSKINEFDSKLRSNLEEGKMSDGVIFICRRDDGRIVPCSPNKILLTKTKVIRPFERVLPVGFATKSNTSIKKMVAEIDEIVEGYNGSLKGEFIISKSDAEIIISKAYDCLDIENEHTYSKESFLAIMKYLTTDKLHVVSGTERKINKHRENRYSNVPFSQGDFTSAKAKAINEPALMLLRQNGSKDEGWSNAAFWWPVLVVQQNAETAVFATEVSEK